MSKRRTISTTERVKIFKINNGICQTQIEPSGLAIKVLTDYGLLESQAKAFLRAAYAIDLAPIVAERNKLNKMYSDLELHFDALVARADRRAEERDRMKAALEWQPIESAPENGDEFLAADANQGFVKQLVYFNKINKCWLSKGQVVVNFKGQFTHWLAIPARAALEPKP